MAGAIPCHKRRSATGYKPVVRSPRFFGATADERQGEGVTVTLEDTAVLGLATEVAEASFCP
uniref:Uncharacterized protein n=1 Tax=Oryza sativa subsp. japonica TaxID=39947 RepID=Q5QL19_ORYSJ|nr:hypothetical protein [Oryza sativa Japonica Group]